MPRIAISKIASDCVNASNVLLLRLKPRLVSFYGNCDHDRLLLFPLILHSIATFK